MNVISGEEEITKIRSDMELFLLAKELGVTPSELKEEPMNEVRKWIIMKSALDEAEMSEYQKAKKKF